MGYYDESGNYIMDESDYGAGFDPNAPGQYDFTSDVAGQDGLPAVQVENTPPWQSQEQWSPEPQPQEQPAGGGESMYIQDNWDGSYSLVNNGQVVSKTSDLAALQAQYNAAMWGGAAPAGPSGPGKGPVNIGSTVPEDQRLKALALEIQAAAQRAQAAYNNARIAMEGQNNAWMNENQKRNLALQEANSKFSQEMQLAGLMSNPRALTQAMSMMGLSQPEIGALLSKSPLTQSLVGQIQDKGGQVNPVTQPTGQQPVTLSQGPASPTSSMAAPWTGGATVNNNPDFNFIKGRQLPMQAMSQAITNKSPVTGLISGLAEYSGQDANNFWGDFQAALPQGTRAPLTRMV
jgi:hypothetical protein